MNTYVKTCSLSVLHMNQLKILCERWDVQKELFSY